MHIRETDLGNKTIALIQNADLAKRDNWDEYLDWLTEFLKAQKNCLSEYVGTELSLKRGITKSMLELQKKHHEARMERDKELYERQIKVVDAQIDRLVYVLYGLTEEEVKVVEGAF